MGATTRAGVLLMVAVLAAVGSASAASPPDFAAEALLQLQSNLNNSQPSLARSRRAPSCIGANEISSFALRVDLEVGIALGSSNHIVPPAPSISLVHNTHVFPPPPPLLPSLLPSSLSSTPDFHLYSRRRCYRH